jgi:hypothetical protein
MAAVERKLAAILATDVPGYLWLIGADEEARSNASRRCAKSSSIRKFEHRGRIVRTCCAS